MENAWVFLSIFRSTGKYNKTTQRIGEPGKLVLILSHSIGAFFPMRFSSYCILPHMRNGLASSSISHSIGKCSKSKKWRKSGKLLPIPFSQFGCFFPLVTNPLVYFIIWEMHGFPHQFLIAREYATKSIVLGEPEKLLLILFQQNVYFFPIISTFHGRLCYMGSAWVSSQHREMQRNPSNWLSLVN